VSNTKINVIGLKGLFVDKIYW